MLIFYNLAPLLNFPGFFKKYLSFFTCLLYVMPISSPLYSFCLWSTDCLSNYFSLEFGEYIETHQDPLTGAVRPPKTVILLLFSIRCFDFGLKSRQCSGCEHYIFPAFESTWRTVIYYNIYFIFITSNAVVFHQPFYVSNIHPANMEKDWIEGVRLNYIGGANDLLSVKPFTCQIRVHP
jgi:hypothetical protein